MKVQRKNLEGTYFLSHYSPGGPKEIYHQAYAKICVETHKLWSRFVYGMERIIVRMEIKFRMTSTKGSRMGCCLWKVVSVDQLTKLGSNGGVECFDI